MPLCQEARLFSKFSRLFSKSVRPCQEIKVVFKVRPSESLFSNYPLPPPPLFYSRFYVGRTHMKAPRKLLKFLGVSKIYSRTTPNNTKWVLNQKFTSSTPIYSKPLCSITQCYVIEFSCYKLEEKNQKTHFEHPKNFWKLYQFNL